jgi:hypothetical protein
MTNWLCSHNCILPLPMPKYVSLQIYHVNCLLALSIPRHDNR